MKNRDLWEQLDRLVERRSMTYQWVRGHASHSLNNRCDEMAVAAALGSNLFIDAAYEKTNPYPKREILPVSVPVSTSASVPAFLSQADFPGFL